MLAHSLLFLLTLPAMVIPRERGRNVCEEREREREKDLVKETTSKDIRGTFIGDRGRRRLRKNERVSERTKVFNGHPLFPAGRLGRRVAVNGNRF